MGPRDLGRVIVRSLLAVMFIGAIVGLLVNASAGAGLAFGGLWSSVNLWVLSGLLGEAVGRRRLLILFLWMQGKLALYIVGAWVLATLPVSILAAVAGFHAPFGFALVESVRLQDRKSDSGLG